MPNRINRNNEHHQIRDDIDDGSCDKQKIAVDAGSSSGHVFIDTFCKNHKDQGDAVQEVEPDDKPSCVEYSTLL